MLFALLRKNIFPSTHMLREETGNIAISGVSARLAIRKYKLHAVLFSG